MVKRYKKIVIVKSGHSDNPIVEVLYTQIDYAELSLNQIRLKIGGTMYHMYPDVGVASDIAHVAGAVQRVGAGGAIAINTMAILQSGLRELFTAIQRSGGTVFITSPMRAIILGLRIEAVLIVILIGVFAAIAVLL